MPTHIALARSDDDIRRCHAVLHQLRPHVPLDGFVERVRRMQGAGYELAFLEEDGTVRAVAGFRELEQLVAGRVLYVDDLVTDATTRSRGHGAALLRWCTELARARGCDYLELDSGTQRRDAHRFYHREGLTILGYHFQSGRLSGA